MIVVAIIGLLAAIAVPSFVKSRQRSHLSRIANDLRVFSAAFQEYALINRQFPPDTHNVLPAGMDEYIDQKAWDWPPFGGHYNWEGPDNYPYAGISVYGTHATANDMRELDELIDDGNLISGHFRRTPNGRYTYIVEE